MPTRVLAAVFNTRFVVNRAGHILASGQLLDQAMIRTSPGKGVTFDRHPADRPATAEHPAKFSKKTLEARAMFERAVVSKEVRVAEEVGVHKDVSDQNETVRATVRRTQVTVEDTFAAAGLTGMATRTSIATGTGIAGAIDRTLETSLSGTNAKT